MPDLDTDREVGTASVSTEQKPKPDAPPPEKSSKTTEVSAEDTAAAESASPNESPETPEPLSASEGESVETVKNETSPSEGQQPEDAISPPEAPASSPASSVEPPPSEQDVPPEASKQVAPVDEGQTDTVENQSVTTETGAAKEPIPTTGASAPPPEPFAEPSPAEEVVSAEASEQITAVNEAETVTRESESAAPQAPLTEERISSVEAPAQPAESPSEPVTVEEGSSQEARQPIAAVDGSQIVTTENETVTAQAPLTEETSPPREPSAPAEESAAEPLPPAEVATQEEPAQIMPAGEASESRPERTDGGTEQIEGSAVSPNPARPKRERTARRAAVASQASAEERPAGNTATEIPKGQTPSSPPQPEVAAQPEPQEPSLPASRIIGAQQPQYTTRQYTTQQYPPPGGTPPPRSAPPEPMSTRSDATTDGGRNQVPPGPPAGRRANIPCVPIVIIAVIVLLFLMALILYRLRVGGPIPPLFASAAPKVSTPAPAFYTDDLYGFTTRYPRAIELNLAAYTADPECKGVVFVDEADTQKPTSSAYPRFKICFVAFDTALPAGDIGGQLEARSDQVERNFLSLPERGLMRGTEVGQNRLPAREVYIRARDRETGQNVKLYEATVEYQHRLYAIEAADLASNWDNTWPIFRDAIAALLFADRVVIPPDAPVVLP